MSATQRSCATCAHDRPDSCAHFPPCETGGTLEHWTPCANAPAAAQAATGEAIKPRKHSHYFKDVSGLQTVDVYRVLQLFNVTDQALGHSIKKLLCAGGRGVKDQAKDVQEAIDTLVRWKEMRAEDEARGA